MNQDALLAYVRCAQKSVPPRAVRPPNPALTVSPTSDPAHLSRAQLGDKDIRMYCSRRRVSKSFFLGF